MNTPTALPTERIAVRVEHCFVEPVPFRGETWNIRFDEQFGTGGRMPANWVGDGVIELIAPNLAKYTDDGGKELRFLPADHPAVREVEHTGCD